MGEFWESGGWELVEKVFKREKVQIKGYLDFIEAPVGFEPTNKGFADLRLKPLGYSALKTIKSTNVD